jgi:hypothetical protein
MKPYEIMLLFSGWLKEVPQNRGLRVEAVQKWAGGSPGDSWCCELWWMCQDIAHKGNFEMSRVQACQSVYDYAKKKGYLVSNPQVGDTFLYVNKDDHAHHIGFITKPGGAAGVAGNTSEDGKSDNGIMCAEHEMRPSPSIKYVRFPG